MSAVPAVKPLILGAFFRLFVRRLAGFVRSVLSVLFSAIDIDCYNSLDRALSTAGATKRAPTGGVSVVATAVGNADAELLKAKRVYGLFLDSYAGRYEKALDTFRFTGDLFSSPSS